MNEVETGVLIIHVPTGLVSQSMEERSKFQNKQRAMETLKEKLADLKTEQKAKVYPEITAGIVGLFGDV